MENQHEMRYENKCSLTDIACTTKKVKLVAEVIHLYTLLDAISISDSHNLLDHSVGELNQILGPHLNAKTS